MTAADDDDIELLRVEHGCCCGARGAPACETSASILSGGAIDAAQVCAAPQRTPAPHEAQTGARHLCATFTHPRKPLRSTKVGSIDRNAHVLIGVLLVALTARGTIGGPGPDRRRADRAAFGSCPLYTLLGVSTCQAKKA